MQSKQASLPTKTLQHKNWGIRYAEYYFPYSSPKLSDFSPQNPALKALPVVKGGRQAAWFIRVANEQPAVLRQYRRGGLVARILTDQYLWLGEAHTRSWQEFNVMAYLYTHGVSVPYPIAALWTRCFIYYRAALITERIPGARTLAGVLKQDYILPVAKAIKHMHDVGVYHADLNATNILIDDKDAVWLIDFDRARYLEELRFANYKNNLYRLRRSLLKLKGREGRLWFEQLLSAYQRLSM